MSAKRMTRLDGAYAVDGSSAVGLRPYVYKGRTSYDGPVRTRFGYVMAMSDAINDLCRYDVIQGGRQYIYYESGTRKPRGLARRAAELGRDASQRSRKATS